MSVIHTRAAVALLTVFSIVPLVTICTNNWRHVDGDSADDAVTRHERRFAALRQTLPPDANVVGYISDPPMVPGDVNAINEYVMTLYTLAPVVVDSEGKHRYVIGNFTRSTAHVPEGSRLVVQQDFGNGVVLFRSDDR